MNTPNPQDDLAYLKSLVAGDGGAKATKLFGQVYFIAGALYGFQTLVQWAAGAGLFVMGDAAMLAFVIAVSAIFIAVIIVLSWRNRNLAQGGLNTRAVNAAFSATGMANLVLIAVIGWRAYAEQSLTVWLLYPIVVFVLQGAAWLVSFYLLRRLWHGLVAFGWFATSLAMSFTMGDLSFAMVVAAALLLLMALPGYVMMRRPRA